MDREILFRGFYPDENGKEKIFINGKWVQGDWAYGYLSKDRFKTPDNKFIIMPCITYEESGVLYCAKIIPETVGQYTELHSDNNKGIFENDICKDSLDNMFVVKWDRENARFLGYCKNGSIAYVGREPKVNVLGNTHNNPELIAEVK